MATTTTVHTTTCPSSGSGAQVNLTSVAAGYREHKCMYYLATKPTKVKVTTTEEVVPEHSEKASPGSGTWVRPVPGE